MNEGKIAVRYAKALFELSREKEILEKVIVDVKFISQVIEEFPQLTEIIESPVITNNQKRETINKLFNNNIQKITLDFLLLIINKGRGNYLNRILHRFVIDYRQYKNIKEAVITTATPLDATNKEHIRNSMEATLNTNVEIIERTDKNIIGGFIIRVDDTQYDASVSSNLENVRRELLKSTLN
ncbi:MAG: ATP synthase F1 subunit delta [Bacteroidales bacterium]|nr:ATP synthase F1 subunit delta [Bacteroidales bacterium]